MGARHADDTELVLAAQAGDQQAFSTLFERWFDRSYDVAWRIVRDRDTAAEVAQDTFLAAWQGLDGLRDASAFGGWVLRTARNRALNRLEKEGRSRATDPGDAADALDLAPVGVAASTEGRPGGDPADAVARDQQSALVWEAAQALGERDLSLLDLHLRHGMEPAEIAEALDVTPNNAHQLLFRLRKKLGGAVRARVLWRGGDPRCDELARTLFAAGVTQFDAKAVKVIEGHVETCPICPEERAAALSPEALFAAVPLLAAPPGVREAVVAALQGAGVPLDAGVATAGGGGTPGADGGGGAGTTPGSDAGAAVGQGGGTPGADLGSAVGQGPTGADAGAAVGDVGAGPPTAPSAPDAWPDGSGDPTMAMAGVSAGSAVPPTSPAHAPPPDEDGAPAPTSHKGRWAVAAIAVLVLLIGGGTWLALADDGSTADEVAVDVTDELAADGPTTSDEDSTTTTTAPAPTTTAPTPSSTVPTTDTTLPPTLPPTDPPLVADPPVVTDPPGVSDPPPAPPVPLPSIGSFSASTPRSYIDGAPWPCLTRSEALVTLRWTVTGATSVAVTGQGWDAGSPSATSQYRCVPSGSGSALSWAWTLTASNAGGSVSDTTGVPGPAQ